MQSRGALWDGLAVALSTVLIAVPYGLNKDWVGTMQIDAAAVSGYDLPEGVTFAYGTAGFRTKGNLLAPVAYRMGMLMTCRAALKGGAVGVMISASHNMHLDNGMKLVDHNGAMLEASWEPLAEKIANTPTASLAGAVMETITTPFSIPAPTTPPTVYIGMDTRSTGPEMVAALKAGITAAGGKYHDYGVVTTPQLHFFVWKTHETGEVATEAEYLSITNASLTGLMAGNTIPKVTIDCSNGVGHPQMAKLVEGLGAKGNFELVNGNVGDHGVLNHLCGADFVQKEKKSPIGIDAKNFAENDHVAAFDGDADRLVYFYFKEGSFHLLDGDRIAVLYATLIKHLVDKTALKPSMGIVQTAYANGGSTNYIRNTLGVEVVLTPTGVKHLHHKAVEYDIGVYFEANGHGTAVFSPKFLKDMEADGSDAAKKLVMISNLVSPVCGDAMTDLLLCEVALNSLSWSIQDWAKLYTDAPSRMTKVTVPDPQRVKTTWDQTQTTSPDGLQKAIDEVVSGFPVPSRSFVRPSGTEPIVRVYAESDTQQNADLLAAKVEEVVKKYLP